MLSRQGSLSESVSLGTGGRAWRGPVSVRARVEKGCSPNQCHWGATGAPMLEEAEVV